MTLLVSKQALREMNMHLFLMYIVSITLNAYKFILIIHHPIILIIYLIHLLLGKNTLSVWQGLVCCLIKKDLFMCEG